MFLGAIIRSGAIKCVDMPYNVLDMQNLVLVKKLFLKFVISFLSCSNFCAV